MSYAFRFHEKNSKEKTQPPHGCGRYSVIACCGYGYLGNGGFNQNGVFMKRTWQQGVNAYHAGVSVEEAKADLENNIEWILG